MITVENISLPANYARATKYPWKETKVGQSFLVPFGDNPAKTRNCVAAGAVANWGSGNYSVYKEDGGFRVYKRSPR